MALLRLSIAFLVSVVSTLCLFGFMRSVTEGRGERTTVPRVVPVSFPRLVPSSPVVETTVCGERPPEKPELERVVPVAYALEQTPMGLVDIGRDDLPTDARPPGVTGPIDGSSGTGRGDGEGSPPIDSGIPDRDALPLVRVNPAYPAAAERRELEGWVHVRFTIAADGSIEDAEVVESSDAVFEASALRAVAKWRYRPSMHAGRPIAAPNQQVLLRFRRPT